MTTIASTTQDATSGAYAGVSKSNGAGTGSVASSAYEEQEAEASGAASDGGASEPTVDSRPSTITVNFQGKLLTLHPLDVSSLTPIKVAELPEERYQAFMEGTERMIEANRRMLEGQYRQEPKPPDLSNYAGTKPYATVVVGGKVVATIDNQGVVGSWGALDASRLAKLAGDVNGTNGPDLAQVRAEQIAAMVGGRVLKEPSAMTQSQFNALPPMERPQATIDYEAMQSDPMYAQLQSMLEQLEHTKQMRAEFLAQQEAQPADVAPA